MEPVSSPVLAGDPLLVPGRTCRGRARADRVTLLVDGRDYFTALAQSLALAERQILIDGWDLDSETDLWRGDDPPPVAVGPQPWRQGRPLPSRFGPLLDELVTRRLRLKAHVLAWDFGTLFAVKRGFAPIYHLDWNSHWRVQVRLDGEHPLGSCLHVKVASVDDSVAFVGGLDISRYRWDRPGHAVVDALRVDPAGRPTPPWHDQQLLVDGDAARLVAAWQRERWLVATGNRLHAAPAGLDAWPTGVRPDLRNVRVGLIRTEPEWKERASVREIEALYLAVIARAQRLIYLENQYITSGSIAAALARRLEEERGPEVVIITSRKSSGFLEQATMDVLRGDFLRLLRQADRYDRLRVLTPQVSAEQHLKVHSKVALIDDWYLSCGSANLAARSMGLDVELDLAIEAEGDSSGEVREFVPRHRARVIGELLGLPGAEVERAIAEQQGSLVRALDALIDPYAERTLVPLEVEPSASRLLSMSDPSEPFDLGRTSDALPEGVPRSVLAHALRLLAGVLVFAAIQSVWHGLPRLEDPTLGWLGSVSPEARTLALPLAALLIFGFLPLPMGALLVMLGFTLGLGNSLPLSIAGATAGAALGWLAGRVLGPNGVRAIPVPRLNAISRRLGRSRGLGVADLRILPRFTWAEVNLVAGASRVGLRDFLVGTVLGLLPGAFVLNAAGAVLGQAAREPGPLSVPLALLVGLALFIGMAWLWKRQELISRGD